MRKFTEKNMPLHLSARVAYLRDKDRRPVGAVCRLVTVSDNVVAEGRSVCSKHDQPNKKIARAVAVGRALKQLYKGQRV